ncbi:MAG: hypothetical protein ACE5I7_17015 [Candidatus Binatia bacterium]
MKFPVVLKTAPGVEARASIYYVVAENGIFQVRDTPIYRAVTGATGPIPGLLPESEQLFLKCPRLPRREVEEVLAFFAEVYHRHGGEAVVLLFYRSATREFRIAVPVQVLPGQLRDGRWRARHAVEYGAVPRPAGFVRFGTIHSHADLPAYASGVDCADEHYEDGLHIVFGDFDSPELSVAVSFVANGVRFRVVPSGVLAPWAVPHRAARADWMACIRREGEVRGVRARTTLPMPGTPAGTRAAADTEDQNEESKGHR